MLMICAKNYPVSPKKEEKKKKKSLERERRAKRKRWEALLLFLSWTIQGTYAGQPNNVTPIVILIDLYCNSY